MRSQISTPVRHMGCFYHELDVTSLFNAITGIHPGRDLTAL
jgi:hypothetical protein